jgi:hypothetical protein
MAIDLPVLEDACHDAIQRLRGALIELMAAVKANPAEPQEVARRFQLNKNLTWKISRIVAANDGFSAIPHIPGESGLEIFLAAMGGAGAPADLLARVRVAMESFNKFVHTHAGDRASLDLILDSMGLVQDEERLRASRERAYQGNSGVWGVSAKARFCAGFLAPQRNNPNLLDLATMGGLVGFHRLRKDAEWPLFQFDRYHDDGSSLSRDDVELIDGENRGTPRLLSRFSSSPLPDIEARPTELGTELVLRPGRVGKLAAFDAFFGHIDRGAPRYRQPGDEYGEFGAIVAVPIQTLNFDIIAHRDCFPIPAPEVLVFGRPGGGQDAPAHRRRSSVIPLPEKCVELAGVPPVVATPLFDRFGELVSNIIERLGHDIAEFRGWRLQIDYPPMPSTVVLRWPLPSAPGTPSA